ncbi:MAG: hypothetical protein ACRC41_11390 [Sarcina sp.]
MKVLWIKIKNNFRYYTKNLGGNGFFDLSKIENNLNSMKKNNTNKREVRQLAKVIQFPR